ncbi:MAG: peptidase S10 [Rubrivivax sp. SCN 71-131]|nr:MAG: peptidase S10 [Rubrivivax sp. SCN 71-131]
MSEPTDFTPGDKTAAPDKESEADRKLRAAVQALLARAPAVSLGTVQTAAATLGYEARVEFLPVLAEGFDGALAEPQAAVMASSYVYTGEGIGTRPVCFAFNGGPGSASVWLHLGALGPKRVVVPDDATPARGPGAIVDNPLTWLKHFDLVFIDPPHTGWSMCASEAARKRMLSVDGDVAALTEVVRAWLTRHGRWGSPVFLAGESYGTTRAAALADSLQSAGVPLEGLVLVSCAMDLQALVFAPANELPHALFLPAFAQVSQYHGLLKGSLGESPAAARAAAEAFVEEEYLAALHLGARLSGMRRARIARRVAQLTGLSPALVESLNLRISDESYFLEALRERGQVVGRLEARSVGPMPASRGHKWEFDPGIEAIAPAYTSAALDYFGQTLGVSLPARFELVNGATHKAWNWNRGEAQGNAYASTTPDLARALRRNVHLRVLVASGRYDLGTPYSASDWSLAHLDVPPDVAARVEHHYYDAGHMMYTRHEDLAKLEADLSAWLARGA